MPELLDIGTQRGMAADGERNPGRLLATDFGRAYTGDGATTPETSILNGGAALAALLPAATLIGDTYEIRLRGMVLNNSGGGAKTTINVYHGAYKLMSQQSNTLTTSATPRLWGVDLTVVVELVADASAAKVRMIGERWGLAAATLQAVGIGWAPVVSNSVEILDGASSGTDANLVTNIDRDFNVTATHTINSASMTTTLNLAQVRYVPRNL